MNWAHHSLTNSRRWPTHWRPQPLPQARNHSRPAPLPQSRSLATQPLTRLSLFSSSHWRPPHRKPEERHHSRAHRTLPLFPFPPAIDATAPRHATRGEGDWDQERRRSRFPERRFPRRARRRATTNRFVYLSLKFFREFLILLCGYPDCFGFYWFPWFCFVIVLCFVVVLILP